MGFFRRADEDETLNEQLLREAHLDEVQPQTEPGDAPPPKPVDPFEGTYPADHFMGVWQRAMARPGEYDEVLAVDAPAIAGDAVEFATLANGDMIVDTEQGDADLSPFADAVEKTLKPPYRVIARRKEDGLWSVAARGIDVLEVDFPDGDEIELSSLDGELDIRVDGEPWQGHIQALEHAGAAAEGADYVVQAERLDGDLWEVRASPL
jgi:hypothetical protein